MYHILLGNRREDYEDKLTTIQKYSRIYQNYMLFYDMVSDYVEKGGSVGDILEALRSLTIIELEIQQENPQEIFESLNSTGLDLTNVDLLRNYFLMQFAHEMQTELYENYWSRIEDAIGVDRMEQFFVDYLIFRKRSDAITINGRRNHINERTLYIAFKDYYHSLPYKTDYEKTSNCFADLKNCAGIYKNFLFTEDVNFDKETPLRKKIYFLLSINESSKSRSLLLYVFDLYSRGLIDDDMLNTAIDAIASLTFRARLCKAKGFNRQFSGSVMMRLDEIADYSQFVDLFWQAITVGKGSYAFPSDAEFMDALVNREIYKVLHSRGTKYLLYMLETHSPFPKGLPVFDNESLSIEHIMPQTLSTHWKNYLTKETMEKYESSLDRLGNLALTNYNGELSNKKFKDKKEIYKDSKFYYTTRIAEYNEWQITQINDRTQKLAKKALEVWQLPAKYQSVKAVSESWHTPEEDTAQFAFTKPSVLLIGSNEYAINYWSDILPILCRLFDSENHEAFMEIAKPETSTAFGIEDDSHNYSKNTSFAHITENVYIRQFMSSATILDIVCKITGSFDRAAGTEYSGNILFSLK